VFSLHFQFFFVFGSHRMEFGGPASIRGVSPLAVFHMAKSPIFFFQIVKMTRELCHRQWGSPDSPLIYGGGNCCSGTAGIFLVVFFRPRVLPDLIDILGKLTLPGCEGGGLFYLIPYNPQNPRHRIMGSIPA